MTATGRKGSGLTGRMRAAKVAIGVGVVLVICTGRTEKLPDLTLIGAIGLGLVICAVAYLATVTATAGRASVPSRAGSAAAVALFVGVALAVAASAGLLVRWQLGALYAARYGTRTTVTLSDQCTVYEKVYRGSFHASDRTECANSTWQADGRLHTGNAIVAWDAYKGPDLPAQIDAYAVDDQAYSILKEKTRTAVSLWGGVPLWLLWAGLATALIALIVLVRLGWASRKGWAEVQDASS
jgi:chromate transport protein ChrA